MYIMELWHPGFCNDSVLAPVPGASCFAAMAWEGSTSEVDEVVEVEEEVGRGVPWLHILYIT